MIADLNKIQFQSGFFAKIICRQQVVEELRDGTLYVLTNGRSEWNDAVVKARESVSQDPIVSTLHVPCSIEALTDLSPLHKDENLVEYMTEAVQGCNMIMPLYTPDRPCKCYIVGKICDCEDVEMLYSYLIFDVQHIYDECSFAAFATAIESDPESAKKVWVELLDSGKPDVQVPIGRQIPTGGKIAFRGKYNTTASEYPFLGKGYEKMPEIPKLNYVDLISSLKKFPDTIESISKSADNGGSSDWKMEYAKICQNLSVVDKNELILELAKHINDKKVLAAAIDAVINKAKSSRLKIRVCPKADDGAIDGRRTHGDWRTYLVEERMCMGHKVETKQWLDFEPAAHVVYIMNLINRINNPDSLSVVDVSKNKEAFVAIYDNIYEADDVDDVDGDVEGEGDVGVTAGARQFERLFPEEESKRKSECSKRLRESYKIITNCVNLQCSFFNENPSPYVTNFDKPLTISAQNIEFADSFKAVERIRKLFRE